MGKENGAGARAIVPPRILGTALRKLALGYEPIREGAGRGRLQHNKSLKPSPEMRLWFVQGLATDRLGGFAMGDTAGRLNSMLCSPFSDPEVLLRCTFFCRE